MKMKDSMDRMEFDQGNLQEEAPRRVQRRKRPELKPIWFAAVAVVLLAVVLIAALTDTTAFDGLRRSPSKAVVSVSAAMSTTASSTTATAAA